MRPLSLFTRKGITKLGVKPVHSHFCSSTYKCLSSFYPHLPGDFPPFYELLVKVKQIMPQSDEVIQMQHNNRSPK